MELSKRSLPELTFFRIGIDFLDLTFVIFDAFRLFGSRTITADFVLGFSSGTFQAEFVYRLIRDFTLESCLELLKGFLRGICFFGRIKDFVGGFYWKYIKHLIVFGICFMKYHGLLVLDFVWSARSKASVGGICFPRNYSAFKYLDLSSCEPLPNFDCD